MDVLIRVVLELLLMLTGMVIRYFQHANFRKRSPLVRFWAKKRGFGYQSKGEIASLPKLKCTKYLRKGANSKAYHVVTGKLGDVRFTMLDVEYRSGNSSLDLYKYRTLFLIHSPIKFSSEVWIRPAHLIEDIPGALGISNIQFESKEFSDKFHVKSENKKFAWGVVHQLLMAILLDHPKTTLEYCESTICMTLGDSLVRPKYLSRFWDYGKEVWELTPEYLVEELKLKSEAA